MKITIIKSGRKGKSYSREELSEYVNQLKDGTYRQQYATPSDKEVCFAAEWAKQGGGLKAKALNQLVLLSLENLRHLTTVEEYKRQAGMVPFTLLAFVGHDGHSLHIVSRYASGNGHADANAAKVPGGQWSAADEQCLVNAFRKLRYIYSSQLGTPVTAGEPSFKTSCAASYDPHPYYNPEAIAISVTAEPEESPEFRTVREAISDYDDPEEIPGMSQRDSWMRRFHDCLDQAIAKHRALEEDELYATAVLETLADGCRQMGLPQAWCARVASFLPLFTDSLRRETIESAFKTAYLRETLKTIPLKFTRPSALLTFKTEAYMKERYTLRLNVMTGTPEYRLNAVGYGFRPLDQAARNTMTIGALKAGIDSWDKDLSRYIDSDLIPKYEPMADYISHLPQWNGRHDYVGEVARRVKTDNPYWEEDFHKWMLSMVAQWIGKDRQHGNAIVPLLIGPQGSGKTTFCCRLLPSFLQSYFNDRLSMKNDNDIYLAMSGYALINIDEFDAMSKSQQPLLKYLLSKHDVKFRPPYGKTMQERKRFASFIATTNNIRPLLDPTGARRFICVYADEIDNSGRIHHEQLYAQLYAELQQGRRYWMDDADNGRLISQNADFMQVSNYDKMIMITYLSPEETPADTKYVPLRDIMTRLAKSFPTFTIHKSTDKELGRRLVALGYDRKRMAQGSAFRVKEASN